MPISRFFVPLLAASAALALCCTTVLAQDILPWGKLDQSSFGGTAPQNPPSDSHGEVTTTGDFKPGEPDAGGKVKLTGIRTSSGFDKTKSWLKPGLSDVKKAKQIKYQQYRFDIAEHWSRELEKALKKVCGTSKDDAQAKGDQAKKDCDKKCKEMMDKFKKETDSGNNDNKVKDWCKKLDELLAPVQKSETGGKGNKAVVMFDPDSGVVEMLGLSLDSAMIEGFEVYDPALEGATLQLPPLVFGGYYMDDMTPMLRTASPWQNEVSVVGSNGDVIAKGFMNAMLGGDETPVFTAWFESAAFDLGTGEQSPTIAALDKLQLQGETWIGIQIETGELLSEATSGFTLPAVLSAEVVVGAITLHPAEPPIFGHPESVVSNVGGRAAFHVLVGTSSELRYVWRHNGVVLTDASRVRGLGTDTIMLDVVTADDAGRYDVLVIGPAGRSVSAPATLVVRTVMSR